MTEDKEQFNKLDAKDGGHVILRTMQKERLLALEK